MFHKLEVDVRELPYEGNEGILFDEERAEVQPRRKREPQPAAEPVVVKVRPRIEIPPMPEPLAPVELRFQRIQYDDVPEVMAPPQPASPAPTRIRPRKVRIDQSERVEPVELAGRIAPPKPVRRAHRRVATRVDRVEWDAEEFSGELKDQVGRRVIAGNQPMRENGEDDSIEVDFSDGNGVS
jgi:uncharacterized protein YjbJ (UPF0337 family)